MKKTWWKTMVIAALLGSFFTWESLAWGPEAQRTINSTAIQLLRRHYVDALRTNDVSFDGDVVRGAWDGVEAMRGLEPLMTVEEAKEAVSDQIQLLREAGEQGRTAYFAYRMGALGSLVADLILPYGVPSTEREQALRQEIGADLDEHVRRMRFSARPEGRRVINDAEDYFGRARRFHANAREIIASDYATGVGYAGYLSNASSSFFQEAIEAVADAWHTVLRSPDPVDGAVEPSRADLAWYLADKIEYLLVEKGNRRQAERVYNEFARINPGIHLAYEQVGDAFYEIGAYDRAVREWENALDAVGPERRRVVEKLARHYREIGQDALTRAEAEPEAIDEALSEAVRAFHDVLRYDQTDDEAAELLSRAHEKVRERDEQRQAITRIMAGGESVLEEARASVEAGDYASAFAAFRRARNLFESVDEDFPEQYRAAQDRLREINVASRRAINSILDDANDALADAERAREDNEFDRAISLYEQGLDILAMVPEDEGPAVVEQKQELIAEAEEGIEQTQRDYERWQQEQEAAEEEEEEEPEETPGFF